MTRRPDIRPRRGTSLSTGMLCVLFGLVALALSHGRDGFDKGFFQGACIALMVLGAYLLGSATFRKGTADELGDDAWLPSRDER
ncbi:hypothetical protein N798_17355 [Knoellia flava TL1]|uniref:Uncharacterized protein n=2 Tax=Knoellia flava TaxID=913969 RepID=A0A8H9FWI1_9MICO|nr:hypothetical protein [Knoellia flava]KGN28847.1 hypothetical protein N798_17355 [Knoellia flava TL1]GGB85705.1 hypothetical protein GCM10011314_26800 [Knoellia flava]